MSDLFEAAGLTPHAPAPLAERLRPRTIDEVVGQEHLLGEAGPIRRMIANGRLGSMILWGPPGTGKTTIARLLAKAAGYEFQQISAVFSGVADLKKAFEQAKMRRALPLDPAAREAMIAMADGDGRYLLTLAETLLAIGAPKPLTPAELGQVLQKRSPAYDKDREEHYNLISALHKSLRGSDCDAALYWLARMLVGGEDPRYIARRLLRFASEDVGMADPQALPITLAAWETYERLGSPEGELAIAQAVVYLGTAPKSNALYTALGAAQRAAKGTGSLMPPAHILNAPTKLMKNLGYGAGYAYDHDAEDGFSGQNYFPDTMPRQQFYHPVERGFEREVGKRLAYWARLRQDRGT
jgi:putative ATPase